MSPPMPELPTAYKLPSHVIANPVRTLGVAISCRNHRLLTSSFVCIARRFTLCRDMSPPYRCFPYFASFSAGGGQAAPT